MSMTVLIGKDPTPSEAHAALSRIANVPEIGLRMAADRKYGGGLFREALALESIVACVRSMKPMRLRLYYDCSTENSTEQLTEFCRQPSNRIALLSADTVIDSKGRILEDSTRDYLLQLAIQESNDLEMLAARTGVSGADLVCLYGSGGVSSDPRLRFPAVAYVKQQQYGIGVQRIADFVRVALDRSGGRTTTGARRDALADLAGPLTTLAFETFENTDRHALRDLVQSDSSSMQIQEEEILRGARGISIRTFTIPRADIESARALPDGSPQPLRLALSDWAVTTSSAALELLEVNVFDSGPGLAARLSGRPLRTLRFEEEREWVHKCFIKYQTSSYQKDRGEGLAEVLNQVAARSGLIRVRTGRTCLYGNFHRHVRDDASLADRLFPEQNRGANNILNGSVITFVLPLLRVRG